MKKIALFAAAMLLCAGISFAQNPVKKTDKKTATIETKAVKANVEEAPAQKNCGNCPHHKQCVNKNAEVQNGSGERPIAAKKAAEAKPTCQKQCGNKQNKQEAQPAKSNK